MSKRRKNQISTELANVFRGLSHPTRIEILFAIGNQEACVCHLETILGLRQAYISQHLMEMRDAGIITSRRDGRFIYYRLANEKLLQLLQAAASYADIEAQKVEFTTGKQPIHGCNCPKCSQASGPLISPESVIRPGSNPGTIQDHA